MSRATISAASACDPLEDAREIIASADRDPSGVDPAAIAGPERWLTALEHAAEAHRAIELQRSEELDRGVGISR